MDLDQLRQILDLVREHELSEFEIEQNGLRLKIRKDASGAPVVTLPATSGVPPLLPNAVTAASPAASALASPVASAAATETAVDEDIELAVVKSPIVGTFYKSPSPTSEPFVSIGDFVEKGSVICIIEAMKLMNEIESDVAGEIVSTLVENGQPVEYGEKLFAIRPR